MPPSTSPARRRSSSKSAEPAAAPAPAPTTEAAARSFYVVLFSKRYAKGLAVALFLYAVMAYGPFAASVAKKLALLHEYSLGWVYVAWIFVWAARTYAGLNANGARAPTGLDRPDQHIYASDDGSVKMVNAGDAGCFNRAQRAAFNLDETMPTFLTGLLLNALVVGPAAVAIAATYAYGAVVFANNYKKGGNRMQGFGPRANAEWTSAALVALCAIKALAGPMLPF